MNITFRAFFIGGIKLIDEKYMLLAIELAKQGQGHTAPNPLVGAIIEKNGKIIGAGYHEKYGEPHAERNALANCIEDPKGATIYVTLEPCCHHGKQPPCTEAIVEAGIKRVVVGSRDPNPMVSGKGNAYLEEHGIEVITDFKRAECDKINGPFFHYIENKMPYVVMKYAMTLDGKIAAYTGESKWVTGEESRSHVHVLRNRYTGIMVGVGTVLADNPELTCRIEGGRNPIRIICDSHLRTPLDFKIVETAKDVPTIIGTCEKDVNKHQPYLDKGCQIIVVPEKDGHVDVRALLEELGERKIDSILLEGGGTLNWTFVKEGLINRVATYVAPKIFGGAEAKSPVEGLGFPAPAECMELEIVNIEDMGDDILIESEVKNCSQE